MPYAENAGVRIHYETDGAGPDLVLQHGFMGSLEDWAACGYAAALRPHYRLILIDARGHGESDKPYDEASYAIDRRVSNVTAVLDALNVRSAHFWGYSMGGYIGFGLAKYAPHRLGTLIVGGAHPYARDQSGHRQLLQAGVTGGGDALVAAFEKALGPVQDTYAASLRAGDVRAWLAAAADRIGIEDVLGRIATRCCIYCGDEDPLFEQAARAAAQVATAGFVALPAYNHLRAFTESNAVLPHVLPFLAANAGALS